MMYKHKNISLTQICTKKQTREQIFTHIYVYILQKDNKGLLSNHNICMYYPFIFILYYINIKITKTFYTFRI